MMLRYCSSILWLAWTLALAPPAAADHWLVERAAGSDLVVLAQLEQIDYDYKRDLPIGGQAWFRPLIRYKTEGANSEILIVAEQGLKDNDCYFPRTLPWDEKPRYLLFLIERTGRGTDRTDNGQTNGHPDGCAIEILVDSSGRYAARWPQPGFGVEHGRSDPALRARVEEMTFQGPFARIEAGDLLAHQRRARAERDFMEIDGTDLVPTRGISRSASCAR